ncbi:NfeD family protein [Clostridium peptidivorans]|uniref:NfeD family protein n=1 Tax=Clostridium peptidivorans TaxID=100174 RepID=UPI000BE3122C|nr:NfeD family protein [Clostridium peptidivorans]
MLTTTAAIMWVIIGGVALAVDLITSSLLYVWFTVGSLAALLALILGYSFTVQVIAFIAVSVLFLAIGYPLAKEILKKSVDNIPTMEAGYVGREIIVDNEVIERAMVKVDGVYWTVKNEGEPINKGDKVKVTGIEGNKLIIKKI